MTDPIMFFSSAVGMVFLLLLVLLVILWFCLPFAVFGVKRRLDRIAEEQQKTTAAIQQLAAEIRGSRAN